MTKLCPSSFFARSKHEKLRGLKLESRTHMIPKMESIIDQLRDVNKKDPNFIWTCMCTKERTVWAFAYTDQTVFEEADQLSFKLMGPCRSPNKVVHAACSCPFERS